VPQHVTRQQNTLARAVQPCSIVFRRRSGGNKALFALNAGVLVVGVELPQPFRSAARLRTSRHKVAVPQNARACVLAVARKPTRSQTRTRKPWVPPDGSRTLSAEFR
jgi:hypothetical protein